MDPVTPPKGGHIVGLSGGPRGPAEVDWAHNRPVDHRPPMPKVGDRVLYRSNDFFDEVEAIVIDILYEDGDPNVYHLGGLMKPDPWPWLLLRIDPDKIPATWDKRRRALARLTIKTREARLEGAAGWLHPLWRMYPRPAVGAGRHPLD